MTNQKWLGVAFLAVGFLLLGLTLKNWIRGRDLYARNAKGLISSLTFIVIGTTLLIDK